MTNLKQISLKFTHLKGKSSCRRVNCWNKLPEIVVNKNSSEVAYISSILLHIFRIWLGPRLSAKTHVSIDLGVLAADSINVDLTGLCRSVFSQLTNLRSTSCDYIVAASCDTCRSHCMTPTVNYIWHARYNLFLLGYQP